VGRGLVRHFQIQYIAQLLRIDRWVNPDRILEWIDRNKVVTLIGTEVRQLGRFSRLVAAQFFCEVLSIWKAFSLNTL
jgi:hypothetical protein